MRKKCPTKADVYNKETSMCYDAWVKAYGKKKADMYWRRKMYGTVYDYEIFTSEDLKKINKWSSKFTYRDKWVPFYYKQNEPDLL